MSSSSKKKLRKEQEAAKLTEKQLAAQKEAKKVNLYTIGFVVVLAALLLTAVVVGARQIIRNTGVMEKNTTAVTIGTHSLSNAELNYYYMDAVNNFYSTSGGYASLLGLDVSKPLNEQMVDAEAGTTWADDFLNAAKSNAQAVYALADAANAAGFALTPEQEAELDLQIQQANSLAAYYGHPDGLSFLKAQYGNGATMDSYREYLRMNTLAQAYQQHYAQSLSYEDEDLRAVEAENFDAFSSYSFHSYYLSASRFLTGGTTDEATGTTTYSDEETAASVTAAQEAAQSLLEDVDSLESFDQAIAALPVNADTSAASTANENVLYGSINTLYLDWLTDDARQAGDMTVIANETTSTGEDGTETTTVNGYYVLYFEGSTDNSFPLSNVRHLLVAFEGGTTDETTGTTTYSDEEKAAAKTEAEELLAQWKAGDATEDSFAALANEHSDDGDGTTGGLYENISPDTSFVTNFKNWCLEDHKPGDTDIVETEYGYHIMYYVGDTDYTYRDYQITNQLRTEDTNAWFDGLLEQQPITDGDLKYIQMDLVLSPN